MAGVSPRDSWTERGRDGGIVIDNLDGELEESCPLPGCSPGEEGSGTSPGGGVDCNGIDSNGVESSPASPLSPVMITGVDDGIVGFGA